MPTYRYSLLIFQAWAETADDCLTLVSGPGVAEFRIGTKVSLHSSVRAWQSSEYKIVKTVVTRHSSPLTGLHVEYGLIYAGDLRLGQFTDRL
jgi:hypothetical protein